MGYIQDFLQYPVFYCSVSVLNLHFEIIWRAKEIELSNDVTAARVLVKNESLQRWQRFQLTFAPTIVN